MGKWSIKSWLSRTGAGVLLAVLMTGQPWAYQGTIACGSLTIGGINLQCAGPDGAPSMGWPGWAVLSVSGKEVHFDGASGDGGTATVPFGNVGVLGANTLDATGSAVIQGNVYHTDGWYGSQATKFGNGITSGTPGNWDHISTGYGFTGGFLTDKLLWYAQNDALAAAALASANTNAAVASGVRLAFNAANDYTLTSDLTIHAVGNGANYVNIGKNLNLNGHTLTFDSTGFTGVDFILDVNQNLTANGPGTSKILLAGGLKWSDLLIDVEQKTTFDVNTLSNFSGAGVLIGSGDLAFDKTQWQGEIIGLSGKMDFTGGSQITNPGDVVSMVHFIPEPGTVALLLAGLLMACFTIGRSRAPGSIRPQRVRA